MVDSKFRKYVTGDDIRDGDLVVIVEGPNRGKFGTLSIRGPQYETVHITNGCVVMGEYSYDCRRVSSEERLGV